MFSTMGELPQFASSKLDLQHFRNFRIAAVKNEKEILNLCAIHPTIYIEFHFIYPHKHSVQYFHIKWRIIQNIGVSLSAWQEMCML